MSQSETGASRVLHEISFVQGSYFHRIDYPYTIIYGLTQLPRIVVSWASFASGRCHYPRMVAAASE